VSGRPSRARLALGRVLAVAHKELMQLVRDRLSLGFIVGIPSLQLLLFGYAINLDVRHVPTAVVDHAQSALSRQLVGELAATHTFDPVAAPGSEGEALRLLGASEVGAVIVIPPDLDRRLYRGRGAEISILADASNPTVAAAVTAAGEGLGARLAARTQPFLVPGEASVARRAPPSDRAQFGPEEDAVRAAPLRIAVVPFYNPERRTPVFIVPGLVGVILTMTMMLMTALAVVRERERGTFEFLIATPVRRSELMVGKVLPYLLVGQVQVAIVLALGAWIFDVPIAGSLLELGLAAAVFVGAMLTLGLVISSPARTQFQAVQMAFFFFLPSMLLSGFMFPFEAMPKPAQWIGSVLPLTHFLRIARGILLKGAPLASLLDEIAAIALFGAATLLLAILTFTKRVG
jgi:ABC-2 type transport system permease protein